MKNPINRLIRSWVWRAFPTLGVHLALDTGVHVSLQSYADIKVLQEIFVERTYAPFLEAIVKSTGPLQHWIDAGCNCGMFSLYVEDFARKNHWQGARHALMIDPNRYALQTARASVQKSGLQKNFEVIEAALAGKTDHIDFYESKATYRSSIFTPKSKEKKRRVECVRLDELFKKLDSKVDLLKMDIEGAEAMVLENWTDWAAKAPHILIEWHEPYCSCAQIDSLLLPRGYKRGLTLPAANLTHEQGPVEKLPMGIALWSR